MQDPRMLQPDETLNYKHRKNKTPNRKAPMVAVNAGQDVQGSMPMKAVQKAPKRNVRNVVSPLVHQSDRSNSDSMPDSSSSGNEYRALRRKYLLLEEESCTLVGDLKVIEEEVDTLENEKLALLDKLVVLEGLVDPSQVRS